MKSNQNILYYISFHDLGDSHTDRIVTSLIRLFCEGAKQPSKEEYTIEVPSDNTYCAGLSITFKRYTQCEVGLINEDKLNIHLRIMEQMINIRYLH